MRTQSQPNINNSLKICCYILINIIAIHLHNNKRILQSIRTAQTSL